MTKQVSRIPVIENTSLGKIGRHKTKNFEHTRRSKLTTLISCGVMSCLKLYPHKHQFGFLWSMVRVAKRFSVKTPTQPKLNSTSIQHNLSWVRHENDFAHHHPTTHHLQKLNVSNISADEIEHPVDIQTVLRLYLNFHPNRVSNN